MHVVVELGTEFVDGALHRPHRGITQGTNSLTEDIRTHVQQQINVARTAFTVFDAMQNLRHPSSALTARAALATGLIVVELGQDIGRLHDAHGVIQDHHATRATHRAGALQGVEVAVDLHSLSGGEHTRGSTPGDHGLQRPALVQATSVLKDNIAQRDTQRQFVDTRSLHVPTHAPHARAAITLRANAVVPRCAAFQNLAHVGQRFDVVDHRGHAERPDVSRKGRFDARVGALAFQRLDQTGLFATDIGSGTTVQQDIEAHIGAENMLTQIPGLVGLVNSSLEPLRPQKKLATQIDEGQTDAHSVTTDNQPFEYLMRIFFNQHTVFEGAWFRLVTVANEIAWTIIFRQKAPFHTSGKAGSPSTMQARVPYDGDDVVWLVLP